MNFGKAIELLKEGKRLQRAGWNSKNQYIELAERVAYINAKNAKGEIINEGHSDIGNKVIAFVGTSGVQLDWLASQADILAEDWKIVENKSMKAIISQPMNGKSNEQIRKEREKVVHELTNLGWEVVDTIFKEEPLKGISETIFYLSKSIEVISRIDVVLFMNGWQDARGCKIEHEICKQYDIPTMYEYEL